RRDRAARAHALVVRTEQKLAHPAPVVGIPIDGTVVLGLLGLEQTALGRLDAGEDRRRARGVLKNADGEVDLVGTGIFFEGFGQAQDGVCRSGRDIFEHLGLGNCKRERPGAWYGRPFSSSASCLGRGPFPIKSGGFRRVALDLAMLVATRRGDSAVTIRPPVYARAAAPPVAGRHGDLSLRAWKEPCPCDVRLRSLPPRSFRCWRPSAARPRAP